MATVPVNRLKCGVTYTIIAGGTLNGNLVGPRSLHGTIPMNNGTNTRNPCISVVDQFIERKGKILL